MKFIVQLGMHLFSLTAIVILECQCCSTGVQKCHTVVEKKQHSLEDTVVLRARCPRSTSPTNCLIPKIFKNIAINAQMAFCTFCGRLQRSLIDWHLLLIEQEKTDSPHLPSRQFIQRRPAAPPAAPSKNLVFNPVSNQMASMNALFSPSHSAALLQGLSSASVSGGDATRATRSLMNDVNGHRNLRAGNTNWTRVNHHDFNLRRKSFCPHWNAWKCHSYFLAPTHPEQQQDFL